MAAQTRQAKVLRIGIIQDGKIVQERLVKTGEQVTVGESSRNTFVFPKTKLKKPEFTLFSWSGGQYHLHFTQEMRGKVSSGGIVLGLDKVRQDPGVANEGGTWTLPLTEHDRGKVAVAPVTVLFQFVAPPPTQAVKPMEAMDFRPRLLDDDDPILLGFMAVWAALALVFSVWVYNSEIRETTIEEIPDRFTRIVMEEAPEDKPEVEKLVDDNKLGKAKAKAKVKAEEAKEVKAKKKGPETKVDEAKRMEASKNKLLQESKMIAKLIGSTGAKTKGIIQSSAADGNYDVGKIKAASDAGATLDGGGGIRKGSDAGGGNRDVGSVSAGEGGSSSIASAPKVELKGNVTYDDPEVSGVELGGVKKVVARYKGQLKYCYEAALKTNPKLAGRVVIAWSVSAEKATDVYIAENTTGDESFASCMKGKVRRWKFTGTDDGGVKMPFVFQPQQ